jgi:type IV pilus assembly protein PilB
MDTNEYLAKEFVEQGLIHDPEEAKTLLAAAEKKGVPFFEVAPTLGDLDTAEVYALIARLFGYRYVTVSVYNLDDTVVSRVPVTLVKECRVVPLSIENGVLTVVTDSPYRSAEVDIIRSFFQEPIEVALTTPPMIDNLVNNITGKERRIKAAQEFSKENEKSEAKGSKNYRTLNDYVNAPSVQFADTLLEEAVAQKASDIHIEPLESGVRVRFPHRRHPRPSLRHHSFLISGRRRPLQDHG